MLRIENGSKVCLCSAVSKLCFDPLKYRNLEFRSHWRSAFLLRVNLASLTKSCFSDSCFLARYQQTDQVIIDSVPSEVPVCRNVCDLFHGWGKTLSGSFSQICGRNSTTFSYDLIGNAQLIISIMFAFLRAWLTITLASVCCVLLQALVVCILIRWRLITNVYCSLQGLYFLLKS